MTRIALGRFFPFPRASHSIFVRKRQFRALKHRLALFIQGMVRLLSGAKTAILEGTTQRFAASVDKKQFDGEEETIVLSSFGRPVCPMGAGGRFSARI